MIVKVRSTYLQTLDAFAGDELTVVEVDSLQVVTRQEVLQRRVGYQRTVVQLENVQVLGRAVTEAQGLYALVRYQLTMRQTLCVEKTCQHTEVFI